MAGLRAHAFHGAGSWSVILVLYSPVIARIARELCMSDGHREKLGGCTKLFWRRSRPPLRLFARALLPPKWMARRAVCFENGNWLGTSRIRRGMV
jgi:hypothetical protein